MKLTSLKTTRLLLGIILSVALFARADQDHILKVTTTNGSGKGSLREAIKKANRCKKPCTITFCLSKSDKRYNRYIKSWSIKICKGLPVIKTQVEIDGYSQHTSAPNTNPIENEYNAHIAIELCGPGLDDWKECDHNGLGTCGLTFGHCSNGSQVKGLAITNFPVGIEVSADQVQILGCIFGIGTDGYCAQKNLVSIYITKHAHGTVIGTVDPSSRNLIAGLGRGPCGEGACGYGILGAITNFGKNTTIQNSTVNLTKDGYAVISSACIYGIVSIANSGTYIGGPEKGACVVVSGYTGANILFDSTIHDTVQYVYAGTNATGTAGLGGGAGIKFITSCKVDSTEAEFDCLHLVDHCLTSGNNGSGIVIGQGSDPYPVTHVCINNTKSGTEVDQEYVLPNGAHGLDIGYGEDTHVTKSVFNFNGVHGVNALKTLRTMLTDCDVSYNTDSGLYFVPPCFDETPDETSTRGINFNRRDLNPHPTLTVLFGSGFGVGGTTQSSGCYRYDSCGNLVRC